MSYNISFITSIFSALLMLLGYQKSTIPSTDFSNTIDPEKMLIIITPPSIDNTYYKDVYDEIIAFDIAYAKQIMERDNVIVLADKATLVHLAQYLPQDILLEQKLDDIWLRDCSTVNPAAPVQFRYAAAAQGSQSDADFVQETFNVFLDKYGIDFKYKNLILDGGNYVDNYHGRAIVSECFWVDSELSYPTGKQVLQQTLGLQEVAIIPVDDPKGLAHAEGQVMFIDENIVAITGYQDQAYLQDIKTELNQSFPGIKTIVIPTAFDTKVWDPKFKSAGGIHVNSTVTNHYIYLPTFYGLTDETVLALIRKNSKKEIIPIDASDICMMGGSVRCLAWQLMGIMQND